MPGGASSRRGLAHQSRSVRFTGGDVRRHGRAGRSAGREDASPATGVWAGEPPEPSTIAGRAGACDPAWSPDGRRLALTAADGFWVFPADSSEGELRVEARLPVGGSSESHYRAFSHPRWSPDGVLVALLVSNGGTSWVEVFEVRTGRLFYTSPPGNSSFSWTSAATIEARHTTAIQLPTSRR